jgi:prepilin peptidase CpaA
MLASLENSVSLASAALCGCAGAVCDLRTRRIPNRLTGAIFLLGIAIHTGLGGWRGLTSSVLGAMVAGGCFLLLFLLGGMGGGDVKLMTALGSVVGLINVSSLLLATALLGGLLALAMAVHRRRVLPTLAKLLGLLRLDGIAGMTAHYGCGDAKDSPLFLPYGVAIAAGAVTIFAITACSAGIGK